MSANILHHAELKQTIAELQSTLARERTAHEAVVRERDTLRQTLYEYGYHKATCSILRGWMPCDCGWELCRTSMLPTK